MTIYFTSDLHFFHERVIAYSKRPFKNAEEMNEGLITNHNAVVRDEDEIYYLGDISFGKEKETESVLRRLNGTKYLLLGNHDRKLRSNNNLLKYFQWAKDYAEITVEKQFIVLMHYALRTWNKSHYGSWSLFGHSHNSLPDDPNLLSTDVGVDAWNYYPVSFEQLKEHMAKKVWKPIDHHGKRESETKE